MSESLTDPPVGDGKAVDPAEAWFDQLVVPVDDARLQVMREPTLIMRQRVIPRTADPTVLMPALEAPAGAAVAADPASAVLSVPPPMRRLPSARAWALAVLVAVGGVGAGLWLSAARDPVVDVVELRDPAPVLPRGALAVTEPGLPEGEAAAAPATAESPAPTTPEASAPPAGEAEPEAVEAAATPEPTTAQPEPTLEATPEPTTAAPAAPPPEAAPARAAAATPSRDPSARAATPREARATKAKKRTKPSPRPSWKPTPTAAPTLFSGSEL